jgi:hypothetical protein
MIEADAPIVVMNKKVESGVSVPRLIQAFHCSAAQHRPVDLFFLPDLGDRAQSAPWTHRRALIAIRDHPLAAATMGVDTALYQVADFWRQCHVHRHCRRAGRAAVGLCLAGQLPLLSFDQIPGLDSCRYAEPMKSGT